MVHGVANSFGILCGRLLKSVSPRELSVVLGLGLGSVQRLPYRMF